MIKLEQYDNKQLRKVILKNITIWFSYETPIAFKADFTTYVARNKWSNTTGKHLGIIKREANDYTEIDHEVLLEIINSYI